jgi:hypothetical protein
MNRVNINSNIWGPKAWFFLDSVILSYPLNPSYDDKKNFKDFYSLLGEMLPCAKCRVHYTEFKNKFPLTDEILSNKNKLINWFLKLHNNIRLKFQEKTEITLQDYYEYYSKYAELDINPVTTEIKPINPLVESFFIGIPSYVSLISFISIAILSILFVMLKHIKFTKN